jgi:hypothetical protein
MSLKTDSPEFAPGFLWQLVLVTAVVLSLVLFSDKLLKSNQQETVQTPRIALFPWVLAGAHTIENGLLAFSGKPAEPASGTFQVSALAGLLVVGILCPTIFLLRWRRRRLESRGPVESRQWRISHVFYGLCGALIVYLSVASLPSAVFGEISRNRLRQAQAVQSNRDAIINELNLLAYDLFQYYVLPKEFGGGEHTYNKYRLPESASKTAEATYAITPGDQMVGIRAVSVRYPSCWVEMKVDSLGRMSSWQYGGKFQ